MDGLANKNKNKQANSENFLLPCNLYRLPQEGMAQIKGGFSYPKMSGLKVYFPTLKDPD